MLFGMTDVGRERKKKEGGAEACLREKAKSRRDAGATKNEDAAQQQSRRPGAGCRGDSPYRSNAVVEAGQAEFRRSGIMGLRLGAEMARPLWRIQDMVQLSPVAVTKVKEILSQQTPAPVGLRVAVVGGGCSGFSYNMAFENQVNEASDNVYEFDGLKVLVDQMSEMYLDGISIDYIETIEGSGFKFNNPNVKSTCGCGSSFSV
jgi:iron-sulfur cluster assembly accessory protein